MRVYTENWLLLITNRERHALFQMQ